MSCKPCGLFRLLDTQSRSDIGGRDILIMQGIPDQRPLQEGDIINLDVSLCTLYAPHLIVMPGLEFSEDEHKLKD